MKKEENIDLEKVIENLQFTTFSKDSINIFEIEGKEVEKKFSIKRLNKKIKNSDEKIINSIMYSPNGKLLSVLNKESVDFYDTFKKELIFSIEIKSIENIQFSPKSSYFITLEKYNENEEKGNLKIFSLNENSANEVINIHYSPDLDEIWPVVQFVDTENLMCFYKSVLYFFSLKN
jgi:uncharacterized protein with WD repeat